MESNEVICKDLQEVCECITTECNFRLNISELQTFTSYEVENGVELTEGASGTVTSWMNLAITLHLPLTLIRGVTAIHHLSMTQTSGVEIAVSQ